MSEHEITAEGESTLNWALREPGFLGTIKQLTRCGRCGGPLPLKKNPRMFGALKSYMHFLCDDCFEALP